MRERPIIFSAPMVRAILDGRKTQTRRVVKPHGAIDIVRFIGADNQPTGEFGWCPHPSLITKHIRCPYGQRGDRLWVRETWGLHDQGFDTAEESTFPVYRADTQRPEPKRWRPSIHMPRWASRLTLEVTGVRVERLQDMEGQGPYPGESDALAEGVHSIHHGDGAYYYSAFRNEQHPKNWCDPTDAFRELWQSINGAASWDANPWVWVVEFRRIAQGEKAA